ncbi:hypothetical protein QN239_07110 [Mycolicibacterium sp. Y3]
MKTVYDGAGQLFSTRGVKIVDRAISKGTIRGHIGMQLLFEPAMLLSLTATPATVWELADIAKDVPFVGNYTAWSPVQSMLAAAYRVHSLRGDVRAGDVELWLSLPENGGIAGPPIIHEAMQNRLRGDLLDHFNQVSYQPPLKLPQFSFVIGKLRELGVMWAFGGSEVWNRSRIDQEIAGVHQQLADFLV